MKSETSKLEPRFDLIPPLPTHPNHTHYHSSHPTPPPTPHGTPSLPSLLHPLQTRHPINDPLLRSRSRQLELTVIVRGSAANALPHDTHQANVRRVFVPEDNSDDVERFEFRDLSLERGVRDRMVIRPLDLLHHLAYQRPRI